MYVGAGVGKGVSLFCFGGCKFLAGPTAGAWGNLSYAYLVISAGHQGGKLCSITKARPTLLEPCTCSCLPFGSPDNLPTARDHSTDAKEGRMGNDRVDWGCDECILNLSP
jgi:hypothetical protein